MAGWQQALPLHVKGEKGKPEMVERRVTLENPSTNRVLPLSSVDSAVPDANQLGPCAQAKTKHDKGIEHLKIRRQ